MADLLLNSTLFAGQTIGAGDVALIGQNGQILSVDFGLTMSGNADATIDGAITAQSSAIRATNQAPLTSSDLFVGGDGTLTSNAGSGVSLFVESTVKVVNAGTILGGGNGVGIADSDGAAGLQVNNSGSIAGDGSGVFLDSGTSGSVVANSGTISGFGSYGVWISGSGQFTLHNSGQIHGVLGAVNATSARSVITNSGELHGRIDMGSQNDIYDGRDGLHAGSISAGGGQDRIIAGANHNEILGDSGNDTIAGGAGNDTLSGGSGDDTIFGGSGDDEITGGLNNDSLHAGAGNDSVDGEGGADFMRGMDGNDTMNGGSENDTVHGGMGDDVISGGARHDLLNGGRGDDTLTGNGGADVFQFNGAAGMDTITDFQNGLDRIDLSAMNVVNFAGLTGAGALSATPDGVTIDFSLIGGGGSVFIDNVSLAQLNGLDFIF